jgi:amino acid adenylation domain-containing protein
LTPTLVHDILDRTAQRHPDRSALRRGATSWTYAALRRHSLAWADRLRELGVERGDRVLIAHPHAPQTVGLLFALARIGAVYVIIGDSVPPPRFRQILADCQPRVVIAGEPGARIAADAGFLTVAGLDALPMRAVAGEADAVRAGLSVDPVSLIYTSGTTTTPKAVVSTHRQVVFAAEAIQSRLGYRSEDVVFCCLPLSFDYGLYQVFLCCLGGSELVLGEEADAGPGLLARLVEHRVTVLPAVPSLASTLLLLAKRSGPPPDLRMVTSSGAALARAVPDGLRSLMPALDVVLMFGLTECKRVAIMEPNGDRLRPGAAGRALPDTEFFVVDENGRRLPAGEIGELVVRGPHVMAGYWRARQLSEGKFRRDEFGAPLLFTGDQCRVDADGYLYFEGRVDDIYKQRGYRVSAVEVESAAVEIPAVRGAALLTPTAERQSLLVVAGDLTASMVIDELGCRLEEYKLPRHCVVLDELPLGPTGKVDKRALAASYADLAQGAGAIR